MTRILLIYTGGTIGMFQNPQTGALENFDFNNVLIHIPELRQFNLHLDSTTFEPPIDSSDMDPEQWSKLVRIISDNYEQYDGFVVLHGTDTMAFTASALSFMLEGLSKPVVLTGSQVPIGTLRTDGKENLITAIEIASSKHADGSPMVPEVCILFHDKLIRGNRATKTSADQFDAFKSFNYPLLARAAVEIEYNEEFILPYNPHAVLKPHFNMDTHMVIFSLFPGIQSSLVEKMLDTPELKGIILRSFGSGNAPQKKWLADALTRATQSGKVIVNITQCTGGSVVMQRYETGIQLLSTGVISGYDSTVEASITKLMFLFGEGLTPEEVRKKMNENLAGEITL
ncbi:MAG: type I asparaginase [Bacteroidaceae bacterium]|nr:type I asparaginase [Bacteroidaceae bacterium]